jgi:hypothetical protein
MKETVNKIRDLLNELESDDSNKSLRSSKHSNCPSYLI